MRETRLSFIGDELVAGHGDGRALGWTGRVMARTPRDADILWTSLAVPGETTAQMSDRWGPEVARRSTHTGINRLVVGLGVADVLAGISYARSRLALANKESLVVGGALVREALTRPGQVVPVDSEHSAIAQALASGRHEKGLTSPVVSGHSEVRRLVLTASGGPFRGRSRESLTGISAAAALKHPTWDMGPVVTINSSTLINKGLELIEAHLLFDVVPEQIDVVVHPQSVIHSMVEFIDGATLAQASPPDMRLPISYALGLTERVSNDYPRLNFLEHTFTFERPNMELFPNLALAYRALELGGTAPCVLNAANEIAVEAFLAGKLGFRAMSTLIAQALEAHRPERSYDLQLLSELDAAVRAESRERLNHIR